MAPALAHRTLPSEEVILLLEVSISSSVKCGDWVDVHFSTFDLHIVTFCEKHSVTIFWGMLMVYLPPTLPIFYNVHYYLKGSDNDL